MHGQHRGTFAEPDFQMASFARLERATLFAEPSFEFGTRQHIHDKTTYLLMSTQLLYRPVFWSFLLISPFALFALFCAPSLKPYFTNYRLTPSVACLNLSAPGGCQP